MGITTFLPCLNLSILQMALRFLLHLSAVVLWCSHIQCLSRGNCPPWNYDRGYAELYNITCTILPPLPIDVHGVELRHMGIASLLNYQFANLSSLIDVYIEYNRLSIIPATVFSGSCHIEKLSLQHNRIQHFPYRLFQCQQDMIYLDIRFNNIKHIPSSLFHGLPLTKLLIDHNELNSISPTVFHGMKRLTHISLAHNEIVSLPRNVFIGSPFVRSISLRHNKLLNLDTVTFVHLKELSLLDLGENNLPWLIMNMTNRPHGLSSTVTCGQGRLAIILFFSIRTNKLHFKVAPMLAI